MIVEMGEMLLVSIVGIGPGCEDYILPIASKTIKKADKIIGFKRAINSINVEKTKCKIVNNLTEILEEIKINRGENITLVSSGDPCFFGITNYIKENYEGEIEVIPGITSYQYLFSKLNKPWQGSYLGSLHGRYEDFLSKVKNNYSSVWLTDYTYNAEFICKELYLNNIEANIYVGENLSYEDEKITVGRADELIKCKFSGFSVVIIENRGICNNDLRKG